MEKKKTVLHVLHLDNRGKIVSIYERSPSFPTGHEFAGSDKSVKEYVEHAKDFYNTVLGYDFSYEIREAARA